MNGHQCNQTEKSVLSAALTSPEKLFQLMEYTEDIFYYNKHIIIYNALRELYEDDKKIDSSVLTVKLKEIGIFENVELGLIEVYKEYAPISIDDHLERLDKMSSDRKLMVHLQDAYVGIKNNDLSSQQFIDKIIEINDQRNSVNESEYTTVKDQTDKNLDDLFKHSKFIKTGIRNLDEKLYGLRSGQLIIIAGRPGMGKSTLALQMAKNIKNGVAFFSLEMDADELYLKILSNQSNVDSNKIEHRKMNDQETQRVLTSHTLLSSYDIRIFDKTFDLSTIKVRIKKIVKRNKSKVIFIDYLQLMTGGIGDTKDQKIGSITRTFKLLAKELEIPIVLLSQLSRDIEKTGREPVLSDLRESGNIEQDADAVIFVHEKDMKCLTIVAKNRKGKTGKIDNIIFEKEFSKFRDSEVSYNFENPEYFNN